MKEIPPNSTLTLAFLTLMVFGLLKLILSTMNPFIGQILWDSAKNKQIRKYYCLEAKIGATGKVPVAKVGHLVLFQAGFVTAVQEVGILPRHIKLWSQTYLKVSNWTLYLLCRFDDIFANHYSLTFQ